MMTIVYISSEYPPLTGTGGIGTYTKHIAEGMSLRGHAVHVISRSPSTQYYEQTIKGVTIHRIPPDPFFLPQGWYLYYIRMILRWFFYNTLVRLSWASAAARELQRLKQSIGNIDIVEYPECGAEGFFVRKTAGSAVIVRLHTPWYIVRKINTIRECPGDHLLFRFLERHTIAKADCITVPTRAVVSLLKLSGNRNSVRVLPNPVAPTVKPQHTDRRLWIYTGRVERRKGVDLLIDAYFNVCQTHEPPDLLLVGAPYGIDRDGISYENKIEQRIADSPHSKKNQMDQGCCT
ncbi:MAG TPA: glycosyltransferase [Chitinispirillaceae bacterium]|nr:glycosyltransferase [Chitinispirillaceae bacterium]